MICQDLAKQDQDTELMEEFGFNYPRNISDTRNAVRVLENFNMWPEPGGLLDQDALFVDDILTYKNIENWKKDQNKPKGDAGG
jgi:hypothetical protein